VRDYMTKNQPDSPHIDGFTVSELVEDFGRDVSQTARNRMQLFIVGVEMLRAGERIED
jgi:hypothetical protein